MASVDIKDAHYSVPIEEEDKKYLKFVFEGQLSFAAYSRGSAQGHVCSQT